MSNTLPVKRKMGRPTIWVPDMIERVLGAAARGLPMRHIAAACGFSTNSFLEYRKNHPEFEERLQKAISRGIDSRLRTVLECAESADEAIRLRAATWWLEHSPQCAPLFSRSRVEVTGADGQPLTAAIGIYLPKKDGERGEPRLITAETVKEAPSGSD